MELDPTHLSAEGVERYLRQHGLAARKSRSQNHLVDGQVIEDIVALAQPATGSRVLEIGPGLGVLTGALLAAGARLTAVEVDQRLAAHLPFALRGRSSSDGRLRLVEADVLDVPLDDHRRRRRMTSSPTCRTTSPARSCTMLLGNEPRPERFVVMVQREVAERIAAAAGAMSYLSVFVQYHAAVRVARIVPAAAFEPAPEVQSAVLVGETRPRAPGP